MDEAPQVLVVHFYGKSDKPGNISHDLLLLHVTFATATGKQTKASVFPGKNEGGEMSSSL